MGRERKRKVSLILALSLALLSQGCGAGSAAKSTADTYTTDQYDMEYDTEEYETEDSTDAAAEESVNSGSGSTETVDEAAASDASKPKSEDTSQKLIKTVSMTVETKNFDSVYDTLEKRVEELGGYIENSEISGTGSEYNNRWASLTIRVPSDQLEAFLETASENTNVTYQSENTQDVTLSYVDLKSHIESLRIEQESLTKMLEKATDLDDIFSIQSELTEVRYQIESYESQLRVMENQVSYSTVNLDITEVERETKIVEEKSFWEEARAGFADNLYHLGQGLRAFAIWFIGSLPYLIPVAVMIFILVIICHNINKKNRRKREEMMRQSQQRMQAQQFNQNPSAPGNWNVPPAPQNPQSDQQQEETKKE